MIKPDVQVSRDNLKVGRIYQHFKGNLYLLTGVSKDAETHQLMCEYTALYGDCYTYTRQAKHFLSTIDKFGRLIQLREDNKTGQEHCFVLVGNEYGTELKKIRS